MRQHDFEVKYAVNRADHLLKPRLVETEDISIPERVIFHYFPVDDVAIGIEPQHPLIKNVKEVIYSENILELARTNGTTKYLSTEAKRMDDSYFRRYRQFRRVRDIETVLRGVKSVIIENLALLPHLYRYRKSMYMDLYKWENLNATLFDRIEKIIKVDPEDHDHYLYFELPKKPMRLKTLRRYVNGMTDDKVRDAVKTYRQFNVADLFTWVGDDRFASRLSDYSYETLKRVKLVIYLDGIWTVLGLEELNSYRRSTSVDTANGYPDTSGLSPKELQLRLLRLFNALYEKRKVSTDAIFEEDSIESEEEGAPSEEDLEQEVEDDDIIIDVDDDDYEDEDLGASEELSTSDGAQEIDLEDGDNPEDRMLRLLERKAERGDVTANEYRRFAKAAVKYKDIDSITGSGKIEDDLVFKPEAAKVKKKQYRDSNSVTDKSMLESSIDSLDEQYTKEFMQKDVVASVMSMQNKGVAVTDLKREVMEDPTSKYEVYTIKLTPLEGEPSTLKFKLPYVERDGTFTSNGIKYRLKPQRVDIPIRKVSPHQVALTTNYGKLFVNRSQRKANNYGAWLSRTLTAILIDEENNDIKSGLAIDVFSGQFKAPRIYSTIGQTFSTLKLKGLELMLDSKKIEENFKKNVKIDTVTLKDIAKKDMVFCGVKAGKPVVVDFNDAFYVMSSKKDIELLGSIEDLIPSMGSGPTEFAELKVFNKSIPLAIVLGFALGLENLMKVLKVDYRRVGRGERMNMDSDEYAIRFNDESLIFQRGNTKENLILSGFNLYHNQIKQYSVYDFNKPDVYYSVLEKAGLTVRYIREISNLYQLFVDMISKRFLKKIKEPTTFRGLMMRSAELLTDEYHLLETDIREQRIRRYDKFPAIVYEHLVKAMRAHDAKPNRKRQKIEMAPFEIWNTIQEDPALGLVQESTPIHNLREKEVVTFVGHGGRSKETMVGNTRRFNKSDIGIFGESSTDDSNAGITTFLSPNTEITDVYGFPSKNPERKPSTVFGSPALISPFSERDDSKRVMFIGIQQSSATHAEGYVSLPVGTGYENVVSQRVDDLFAYHAAQDGKIVENDGSVVTVEYKDGSRVSVEIGKRYGKSEGHVIPHELICDLKVGAKVKAGDNITRNKHFFEPNPMSPKETSMRGGVVAFTALIESSRTIEDSSAISRRLADKLKSNTTKIKEVTVPFDKIIHDIVKEGSEVDSETILCKIEERLGEESMFDEKSLETLKKLSRQAPKSGVAGKVELIEAFYYGDKDDMDESLRKIANRADRLVRGKADKMGKNIKSAQVDGSLRVNGKPLEMDHMLIRFYITSDLPAGAGDKGVFCLQLKTVFQGYLDPRSHAEDGTPLDATFGYKSISNRTVNSAELIGQATTVCVHLGNEFAKIYRGK